MIILHAIAKVIAVGLAVHLYAAICMGIAGLVVKLDLPEDTGNDKAQFVLFLPVILGAFIFVWATWPAIEKLRDELSKIPGDMRRVRERYWTWTRRLKALVRD